MSKRYCKICGDEDDMVDHQSDFYIFRDQSETLHYICKECYSIFKNQILEKEMPRILKVKSRRAEWLIEIAKLRMEESNDE